MKIKRTVEIALNNDEVRKLIADHIYSQSGYQLDQNDLTFHVDADNNITMEVEHEELH